MQCYDIPICSAKHRVVRHFHLDMSQHLLALGNVSKRVFCLIIYRNFGENVIMSKLFVIVKYTDEDDVLGIIPSNWILADEEQCYYPLAIKSNEAREKLIRNATDPDKNWALCPIKVVHKFETYSQARLKLKKAEDTSNLDSEEDSNPRTQRKRKLCKPFWYSDDDNETEDVIKPQKINKTKTILAYPVPNSFRNNIGGVHSKSDIASYPILQSTTHQQNTTSYINVDSYSQAENLSYPSSSNNETHLNMNPHARSEIYYSRSPSTRKSTVPLPNYHNSPSTSTITSHYTTSSAFNHPRPNSTNARSSPTVFSTSLSESERFILGQVQATVASLADHISVLSSKIDLLLPNHGASNGIEFTLLGRLPLINITDFNEMEERITNDKEFANQFVTVLASVGGKDIRQCVNNIMRRLLSDELAEQFSFSGKIIKDNKKMCFSSKQICTSVHLAVRKICKEANDDSIKKVICSWLQQAKTRHNRRGQRNNEDENST